MIGSTLSSPDPIASETAPRVESNQSAGGHLRFARFALAGVGLTAVPYLWVLWDLWTGRVNPLRAEAFDSNFYDLQARAIFSGRLSLPKGSIGIEAFVHDGRQFTYFGVFPSLIRMPILAVTHSLDGRLTAPSMLLAWLVTALFATLLVWRVRVLARGDARLGRGEGACLGALVASVTGGSVLVYLAATPWVFDEDFAWSVALTIASLFALLGLLERPSRARALGAGAAVLATALNRAPTGYGCEIAALVSAVWFFSGRAGPERRRFGPAALAIGLVPLGAAGLVNTAKFGSPFALPMAAQVWTSLNAHRRAFLLANGGRAYSLGFLPSTFLAYLRPTGLHLSAVFPFITLPTTPPTAVGGAFLDLVYPTASVPASMPLLFLAGCWGVVSASRPTPDRGLALTRIPLIGAAAACSGALLWGYIADRYLADFLPFLALAAAVGVVDVWRRLEKRGRRARLGAAGAVAVLGLFGVAANVALSDTPAPTAWTSGQVERYISFQLRLSNATGHPLAATVVHGHRLPYFAPAGELFDGGNCQGLYLSTGYSYATVPYEQYEHWTWLPIAQGPSIVHPMTVVFEAGLAGFDPLFQILRDGRSVIAAHARAGRTHDGAPSSAGGSSVVITLSEIDPHQPARGRPLSAGTVRVSSYSTPFVARLGKPYAVVLTADPYLDQLTLSIGGSIYLTGPYSPGGPLVLGGSRTGRSLVAVAASRPGRAPSALCESIVRP